MLYHIVTDVYDVFWFSYLVALSLEQEQGGVAGASSELWMETEDVGQLSEYVSCASLWSRLLYSDLFYIISSCSIH